MKLEVVGCSLAVVVLASGCSDADHLLAMTPESVSEGGEPASAGSGGGVYPDVAVHSGGTAATGAGSAGPQGGGDTSVSDGAAGSASTEHGSGSSQGDGGGITDSGDNGGGGGTGGEQSGFQGTGGLTPGPDDICEETLECLRQVRFRAALGLSWAEVAELDVQVCLDDRCVETTLEGFRDWPEPLSGGGLGDDLVNEAAGARASLTVWAAIDGEFPFDITWYRDEASPSEGDRRRFRVQFVDPEGVAVFTFDRQIDFPRVYGDRLCIGGCVEANVDLRPTQ